MRTALTVITTAILTAIAFLFAWQEGLLGNMGALNTASCPVVATSPSDTDGNAPGNCIELEDGEVCETPWGDSVAHGEAVLSFEYEAATGDTSCEGITSICNNGAWLDDLAPYSFNSCSLGTTVTALQNCAIGDIMVPHDSTNTFYKEIKNGANYSYEAQTRYCFDGQLDGDAGYTKLNLISSCSLNVVEKKEEVIVTPTPAPVVQQKTIVQPKEPVYARCTAPFGGIWTHGQGGTAYLASNVPYGSSCSAVNVVCGYGSIRYGSANNIGEPVGQTLHGNCSVGDPVGCTTACGELAHGETIKTYGKSTISYGSDETCSEHAITSTCSDGRLSPAAGNACSCKVNPPSGCVAPNGQQIAHGSSITLYKDKTIQPVAWDGSDTCVRQGGKCQDGTWHDRSGNPTTLTFQYSTCTILPPPAGEGPGGEGVPQG